MKTQSDMLYFNNITFLYGVSIFNDNGENFLYSLLLATTTFKKKKVSTSRKYQFHTFTYHELKHRLQAPRFKVVLYLPSI